MAQNVVTYSNTSTTRDFFSFVQVAEPEQIKEAIIECQSRVATRDHLGDLLASRMPILESALRMC